MANEVGGRMDAHNWLTATGDGGQPGLVPDEHLADWPGPTAGAEIAARTGTRPELQGVIVVGGAKQRARPAAPNGWPT